MSSDSIERILKDCSITPRIYCTMYDCGQGAYDEPADYVPDMCAHLVGRTQDVMRRAQDGEERRRGFDEGYVSADDWLSQHEGALAERGWARLPVDADGEPIRVGDTVYGGDGREWQVTCIRLGRGHSVMGTDGTVRRAMRPDWLSHRRPATVEGVLTDMHGDLYEAMRKRWTSECTIFEYNDEVSKIIKGYAAKLRLAGGGE